jgi:hypothetical protein
MRKIRQGMEIARLLLDLVGKRERLKQRQLTAMQELFEQELLLGEPFEPTRATTKAPAGEKTDAKNTKEKPGKKVSVTHRRRSAGAVKKATVQQEIEEAVKKSATTSRRKSGIALHEEGRKQAAAEKEGEEDEAAAEPGTKRKRGDERPRATKRRRRSNSTESGTEHIEVEDVATTTKETPAKPTSKVAGSGRKSDEKLKARPSRKRKRDVEEEDETAATHEEKEDEVTTSKTAINTTTTTEVSPVKRVAKRRRNATSPTKAEPMEEEGIVNTVNSDEDVGEAKKPTATKGKNVSTRKSASHDAEHEEGSEVEEEEEEEEDQDDDEEDTNEGENDTDDHDYMKGKRKRKRRFLNEVTAQRCAVFAMVVSPLSWC